MPTNLNDKRENLRRRLAELERVIVAFSGGVDSAVLLKAAVDALGPANVLAVTGSSASLPQSDRAAAEELAAALGVPHLFLETEELQQPAYVANPENRCYHCKTELYSKLVPLAQRRGYRAVLAGTNADDLGDYRPGIDAAREHAVVAPLAETGLTKDDVRALAAELGLPSLADKPASPCLASRIPYGEEVTPDKLARIDAAERFLRELGFRACRVRHHAHLARIEVLESELARFADADLRGRVDAHLRSLGFQYVTLDLRGFRPGSLNEVLVGEKLRGHATRLAAGLR